MTARDDDLSQDTSTRSDERSGAELIVLRSRRAGGGDGRVPQRLSGEEGATDQGDAGGHGDEGGSSALDQEGSNLGRVRVNLLLLGQGLEQIIDELLARSRISGSRPSQHNRRLNDFGIVRISVESRRTSSGSQRVDEG
jgi:hypothetical protein